MKRIKIVYRVDFGGGGYSGGATDIVGDMIRLLDDGRIQYVLLYVNEVCIFRCEVWRVITISLEV